jgi:hypothetical protein
VNDQTKPRGEEPLDPTKPDGIGPWSAAARSSWRAWRNYYPNLALARRDQRTFYMSIDEAADLVGLSPRNFYKRYLATGELPYRVASWQHGPRRKRWKSLIPRHLVMEFLLRGLTREAKATYARRGRLQMDELERELERAALSKLPPTGESEADASGPAPDEYLARPLLPKLDGTRFASSSLALDSGTKQRGFADGGMLGARRRFAPQRRRPS